MDFVVVDVETANADLSSICQIGIAGFCGAALVEAWDSLVNPKDYFDAVNVSIHGIDEERVADAPAWPEIFPEIRSRLSNEIVVSHTPFDRVALARACACSAIDNCECRWLDSARVVRRAWPEFARSGYGLSNVAAHFGIEYRAHDALEDAKCAGLFLLRAIAETGMSAEQWLIRVKQPIHRIDHAHLQPMRQGNPDGELFGEVLVFTGALTISRGEAADLAAASGCEVDDSVTKHTTILVVGDQDMRRLAGFDRSSKYRKAEQLISAGQRIRILSESDFKRVLASADSHLCT